jgi:competence protein ComEA
MNTTRLLKACLIGLSVLVLPPLHAAVPQESLAAASQVAAPVNINTADAATLAGALRGIGLKKAEAIVAYRSEHGPFKSVDELVNVKGIGERTLEQLRPLLAL